MGTATPRDATVTERYDDALFNLRQAIRELTKEIERQEVGFDLQEPDEQEYRIQEVERTTEAVDKLTEDLPI